MFGVRGELPGVMEGWNYDLPYQRGESDFVETRDGFTNLINLTDEDPPILGNETGSTSFNSGNSFPSLFDSLGRTYSANLRLTF